MTVSYASYPASEASRPLIRRRISLQMKVSSRFSQRSDFVPLVSPGVPSFTWPVSATWCLTMLTSVFPAAPIFSASFRTIDCPFSLAAASCRPTSAVTYLVRVRCGLRPAGSPEAACSARSCLRLPKASATLGQPLPTSCLGRVEPYMAGAVTYPLKMMVKIFRLPSHTCRYDSVVRLPASSRCTSRTRVAMSSNQVGSPILARRGDKGGVSYH